MRIVFVSNFILALSRCPSVDQLVPQLEIKAILSFVLDHDNWSTTHWETQTADPTCSRYYFTLF